MEVRLPKGKYVVAVSGGVDSVSLLHALKDWPGLELTVAHFDHGIRPDSRTDREFVGGLAKTYGLPFVYEEGRLGTGTSEATARSARYDFLHRVLQARSAAAMVTAHHRDDVLETAIINLLRGSGRKGLTALADREDVVRPLMDMPKSEIIAYAKKHDLEWREDSTNLDTDYLRNYVRHRLLPRFDDPARARLQGLLTGLRSANREIDDLLFDQLDRQAGPGNLDRSWFVQLPHAVAKEIMAAWLRRAGIRDFSSGTLERLVVAAKTAEAGKTFDVLRGTTLAVNTHDLALAGGER